jgi:hypothetical protein
MFSTLSASGNLGQTQLAGGKDTAHRLYSYPEELQSPLLSIALCQVPAQS